MEARVTEQIDSCKENRYMHIYYIVHNIHTTHLVPCTPGAGAFTASDNALCLKKVSGHAKLTHQFLLGGFYPRIQRMLSNLFASFKFRPVTVAVLGRARGL